MRRCLSWSLLVVVAVLLVSPALSKSVEFPHVTTSDLNGRKQSFPKDLPGERSYVLVAFKREQQADLDIWIEKLGLKDVKAPGWIEMPVVPNYGSVWRAFLDNAMRSGISTKKARARVFTVYADPAKFRSKLAMVTDTKVYVLVVSRSGKILARADGQYAETKAAPLRKAILGSQD